MVAIHWFTKAADLRSMSTDMPEGLCPGTQLVFIFDSNWGNMIEILQILTPKTHLAFPEKVSSPVSAFHIVAWIPYFYRILYNQNPIHPLSFGKWERLLWLFETSLWWLNYRCVPGQHCFLGVMKPHASGSSSLKDFKTKRGWSLGREFHSLSSSQAPY